MRGQTLFFQRAIARSSRSRARDSGFWQLQPRPERIRQIWLMIIHAQMPLDHFGDSRKRPELGRKAVMDRAAQEQLGNLRMPGRVQFGRPAWHRTGRKRLGAALANGFAPAPDRRR